MPDRGAGAKVGTHHLQALPRGVLGGAGKNESSGTGGAGSLKGQVYRGQGCEQCGFTGYESRKGIFELMEPDDEIRKMIVANESSNIIANYARNHGMKTLREDGVEKVLEGTTTVDEVLRVTQDI